MQAKDSKPKNSQQPAQDFDLMNSMKKDEEPNDDGGLVEMHPEEGQPKKSDDFLLKLLSTDADGSKANPNSKHQSKNRNLECSPMRKVWSCQNQSRYS